MKKIIMIMLMLSLSKITTVNARYNTSIAPAGIEPYDNTIPTTFVEDDIGDYLLGYDYIKFDMPIEIVEVYSTFMLDNVTVDYESMFHDYCTDNFYEYSQCIIITEYYDYNLKAEIVDTEIEGVFDKVGNMYVKYYIDSVDTQWDTVIAYKEILVVPKSIIVYDFFDTIILTTEQDFYGQYNVCNSITAVQCIHILSGLNNYTKDEIGLYYVQYQYVHSNEYSSYGKMKLQVINPIVSSEGFNLKQMSFALAVILLFILYGVYIKRLVIIIKIKVKSIIKKLRS